MIDTTWWRGLKDRALVATDLNDITLHLLVGVAVMSTGYLISPRRGLAWAWWALLLATGLNETDDLWVWNSADPRNKWLESAIDTVATLSAPSAMMIWAMWRTQTAEGVEGRSDQPRNNLT